ncbi:MAG TPA: response regulator [Rhizomicrobium sp.]|nr:response regulator [Rhizomicrobium sp.]
MAVVTKADFSRLSIIVIDDSPYMRRLLLEMLSSFGVGRVATAGGAAEAFAEMRRDPPDLIICDWEMYPEDGLSILRRLRQQSGARPSHIPFIMLTGHNGNEDVTTALGEGADSYIVKPFASETLMNHLLKVIVADRGHLAEASETWALE